MCMGYADKWQVQVGMGRVRDRASSAMRLDHAQPEGAMLSPR